MIQTNSGLSIASNISNNVSAKSPPRQIIILNTSNQNQTVPGNKSTHQVILNHPPLLVPRQAETNIVPHNPNIVITPNPTDLSQQTSVIMSMKMSHN